MIIHVDSWIDMVFPLVMALLVIKFFPFNQE